MYIIICRATCKPQINQVVPLHTLKITLRNMTPLQLNNIIMNIYLESHQQNINVFSFHTEHLYMEMFTITSVSNTGRIQ